MPEAVLNGQFRIVDSVNNSSQYFSVEEYKRPKFYVEIKKPAGTYRLYDSIRINGNAKAYAGNNIDGAQLNYRVVRKVRFPLWWGWSHYSSRSKMVYPWTSEEMEITNGTTTTDRNGEFTFSFNAIPDETIDSKSQPIFYYEVTADITDINGETRSGSNSVAVGYQMLELEINGPEKMQADSIRNIRISSKNLNDVFEKSFVHVSLYKLVSPNRIFRERYWQTPDQFLMQKEEFYKDFPYDVYNDEDQMDKWHIEMKALDKSDSTQENGKWAWVFGQLKTGWYKMVVSTKDKYNVEVKAEKYILITDGSGYISEKPNQ